MTFQDLINSAVVVMLLKYPLDFITTHMKSRGEERKKRIDEYREKRRQIGERLVDYCIVAQASRYHSNPDVQLTKRLVSDLEDLNDEFAERVWNFYTEWENYSFNEDGKMTYTSLNDECNGLREIAKQIRDGRLTF